MLPTSSAQKGSNLLINFESMKRILEVLTYINSGGAEMVVYNYLSHMNREGLSFDVLAIEQPFKPFLEDKFKEMGVGVYYLPKNIMKRFSAFEKLIVMNKYDIIHSHCEFLSEIYMAIAAKHGVNVRIIHSHMAGGHYSKIKNIYAPIGKLIAKRTATHFFGCGIDACKSQWGEKLFNKGKCYVLNNAIDIKTFAYDELVREKVRTNMGWRGKHIILNVGRFVEQKNHSFIIDVFNSMIAAGIDNVMLVLIGEGPLKTSVESRVKSLGLESYVQFLGRRNDVNQLLNGADVFFLPSLFEGFPVVSVEAQANGLPIVMSDEITRECGITDLASFVSLNSAKQLWVDALIRDFHNREKYNRIVAEKGYDLNLEAARLRNVYLS